MHALSFQMKQCHLSAVALGRRIFRGTKTVDDPEFDGVPDMTPARFDILYLVFGKGPARSCTPGSLGMATIRKMLGLARSTISEAVKRLVELGLVTCEDACWSDREKVVRLTDEGFARMKRALHLVFSGRALERHYNRLIDKPRTKGDGRSRRKAMRPWRIVFELREVHDRLESLALHLFNQAAHIYDIHGSPYEDD